MPQVENLSESEISELQKVFFEGMSKFWQNTNIFPEIVTIAGEINEQTLEDLRNLREQGLLNWDLEMKRSPFMGVLPAGVHKVECAVYYGNDEEQYCCIGYAFGCINFDNKAFELHFIEKRSECGSDWERQFFPFIVKSFSGYIGMINSKYGTKINQFVIVSPVDGVKKYYLRNGFELLRDNSYSDDYEEVMVRYLNASF